MKNLPQIQPHNTLIQAVNARELHHFLQVQTAFKDWIARRISEYGFLEGVDFCSILSESTGGRPAKEYAITLDMAKELSMVERNEQGKQARRYFIECEKRLTTNLPDFTNPAGAARAWAEEFEKRQQAEKAKLALEHQAKLDAPKVRHYDLVADRTNLINASQIGAKIGISALRLNKCLDEFGVYNKTITRNKRTFNHWFINQGYGKMIQTEQGYDQALFTHLGEAWVIEKLTNEGVIA